ncbi:type II secretion system F family protein [Cellulomonas sp. S1-8]|uniref:type II secretion system F family protein n=1 Tax=Cellulomonas sp. S1-8 TaxID=2904790 RepID=UPI002243FF18|nr:type II secretion system F family protein [Cellulomonas sp. S1-8]UZN02158.1 type II secretion system F family protein [Cellulomonas sp. S1-8]
MSGELVALLIAVPGAVAVVLLLVGYRALRTDALDGLAIEDLELLRGQQRRSAEGSTPLQSLAARLVPSMRRGLGIRRLHALQRRIDEAGRPDGLTVDGFLTSCALWIIIVLPASAALLLLGQPVMAILALVVPVVIPVGRLSRAGRTRRDRIDRDLPDFLDVLAVTVMAGVNFRQALWQVSERFNGPLADEVQLTLHQIANGASVRQGFVDLRQRSASEPVAQFVSALLQSQELGAPLAESLKQIAVDMRRDSGQRQRQRAARTSPKLTLVTTVVLVPGALILMLTGLVLGADIDFGELMGSLEK